MNEKEKDLLLQDFKQRLWWVWILLPFPLLNPIIFPIWWATAGYQVLPGFVRVYIAPETSKRFPTQAQLHSYGVHFYKVLLAQSAGAFILAGLFWLAAFIWLNKLTGKNAQEISKAKLVQTAIGMTLLSSVCGALLAFGIAWVG